MLQSDANTYDKARACQQLAVLGDKEAVPALAALLNDPKLAGHARTALESIPDPSAAAALRAALDHFHGDLLIGVIDSLGARRDAEAASAIEKLTRDSTAGASAAAWAALGRIATPAAVKTLRQALDSLPSPSGRGAGGEGLEVHPTAVGHASLACAQRLLSEGQTAEAIAILDRVREADLPKHIRASATYLAILARQSTDLSLLVEQLKADDGDMFAMAIRASRQIKGPEVTRALLAELDHLPHQRQSLVIGVLGDRRDRGEASVPSALRKAAASGPLEVRVAAVKAIGHFNDEFTVQLLVDTALAADASLAQAARESLLLTRAKGVNEALAARLSSGNPKDRLTLLDIVSERGAFVAVPAAVSGAVAKAADDPVDGVRLAAIRALGRIIGPEDFPVLIGRLNSARSPQETAAVEDALRAACKRVPDRDACVRNLSNGMSQSPLARQSFLLELIGRIGGRQALLVVAARARDGSPEIQDVATRVLGQWLNADAAPVLLDLSKTLTDTRLRARTLRGYLRIARHTDLPGDLRLSMCEEALQAAQSDEEKRAAIDVARIVLRKGATAAQADRAKAIIAKMPRRKGPLFDGRTLDGWEGDLKVWRVRDGLIVGGSLQGNPQNEFLATKKSYGDFVLRLEYKLVGTDGFVNSGVQFRSVRMRKPANEMYGFQADIGAGHSGCLYDESRRNKFLARATDAQIKRLEKPGDWNRYEVRFAGAHIQIVLNGEKTVDYIETDPAIPRSGLIGLQMHGGCKAEVSFRNITLEDLSYAAANRWFGIGKSKWKVVSFSSENTEGEDERAELAIDDNPATFWHTQWNGAQPGHPHYLAVDMGKQAEVSGFTYLPRQDGRQAAGVIGEYEFDLSRDGKQWGQPVVRGRFEDIDSDPSGRVVLLGKPAAGRYFKIVSQSPRFAALCRGGRNRRPGPARRGPVEATARTLC